MKIFKIKRGNTWWTGAHFTENELNARVYTEMRRAKSAKSYIKANYDGKGSVICEYDCEYVTTHRK